MTVVVGLEILTGVCAGLEDVEEAVEEETEEVSGAFNYPVLRPS
jgi:hypothetical protein